MKKLAYVTLHGYGGDKVFAGRDAPRFGGAHLADKALRDAFAERGVECHTPDMLPLDDFDAFFFRDMPKATDACYLHARVSGKPMFLHVWENPYIHRPNADYSRFGEFARVFSVYDDDVRQRGCMKLNYAVPLTPPPANGGVPFAKRKFACMVSSLVKKNRPHCCSYLRLQTIRFYERFHPEAFDLWGANWGKGTYAMQDRPGAFAAISALGINRVLPRVSHPSWLGECEDKVATMGGYRFAYCYENSVELPGYITEKPFDVISAGAVPVYLAQPSAKDVIPYDCFVDRAAFRDDAELFEFLAAMPEERWSAMREAGRRFLASDAAKSFSFGAYVETLVSTIAPILEEGCKR